MLKKISCLIVLAFLSGNAMAQFVEIEDAMSRGKQKGIRIHLDTFNKEIANDAVVKIMENKDHKVSPTIVSFNELFFDNIKIASISTGPVDFYAKVKEVDSSIVLFVDFGTIFLGADTHPKEEEALQKIGTEIRKVIRDVNRQKNIDTLKKRVKAKEAQLERVSDDLKTANNSVKNNIKGATDDDKTVVETETKLLDEKAQIVAIDSIHMIREKEFNSYPLEHLKTINQSKSNALDKNRSTRKNLIRDNVKSSEKITECETEIKLNNTSLEVLKDDPKASKKLTKANQQLTSKINEEKLNISVNDARIKAVNTVITADSAILRSNQDSLNVFDENGRKKELKQMESRREKLVELTQKHQMEIEKNKLEAIQRKKDAETAAQMAIVLKEKEALLAKELEALQTELANLVKQK